MNTKELYYFKTVYEEKSINQAAKKLYITSQGLGRSIKMLETELQVCLFERTKKGVEPTPYAEILYKKAGTIMQELHELSEELVKVKNSRGRFRIGLAFGILKGLPVRAVLDFIRENPKMQIKWREYKNEEVKKMVRSGELDYGLIVGEADESEFIQNKIMSRKIELLVYEQHPFYMLKQIELDNLKGERILSMDEDFHIYHVFWKACREHGFYPKIADKTPNGAVLYRLCKEKEGVAPVMDFTADIYRTEGVRMIPFQEDLQWNVYGICRKDQKDWEIIDRFRKHLKNYVN